jgi:hypothetical protein
MPEDRHSVNNSIILAFFLELRIVSVRNLHT